MNTNQPHSDREIKETNLNKDVAIDEPVIEVNVPVSPDEEARLRNEDPVSGEAGFHPLGTGVGAAVGAATTGAVIGSIAGPVGALAGSIVGGVAGALAGKAVAEEFNPTLELEYWRVEYPKRNYYDPSYPFESMQHAYRVGWETSMDHDSWEAAQSEAQQRYDALSNWENEGGAVRMGWEQAREAAKDAFERMRKIRMERAARVDE